MDIARNEPDRLATLRRYEILDTPPEPGFDRITRLAAELLKVPIAQITLVVERRQWFKSSFGSEVRETEREVSFCAHAILGDRVMVVEDAAADPRFAQNRLVTGKPLIRFYAGAVLRCAGQNLGTLCAIDTVPRSLSPREEQCLRDLASLVEDQLELRLALRQRRQQAAAIDNLHAGVLVTDPRQPDNPIIFANRGFFEITGYAPEEVLGRNCRFLQGAKTNPSTVQQIRQAIESRRPIRTGMCNYRRDGTAFWNDLTISPIQNERGELLNFVGLIMDASAEQQLEALQEDLTAMVVHDLRSPLSAVLTSLDLLKSMAAAPLEAKQLDLIRIAQDSAGRVNELVTSLLDVNRLESGKMPLHLEETDLATLLREVGGRFARAHPERKLEVHTPAHAVDTRCDAGIIDRVLENLLSNAFKFAASEVRLELAEPDSIAEVCITDDGEGIPPEYHQRIFEKFGQVDPRNLRHSTGLGLTFCKLAVEAHGGSICLESAPKKGSTFCVHLPR